MSVRRTDQLRRLYRCCWVIAGAADAQSWAELEVSAAILRREQEEQGLLVRIHGGARALDPNDSEIPVRLRYYRMIAIK